MSGNPLTLQPLKHSDINYQQNEAVCPSSLIPKASRICGTVIKENGTYGWISCNPNCIPRNIKLKHIHYHMIQIQCTGSKKLLIGSQVEFSIVHGIDGDWASNITMPGGGLLTYEKPHEYGLHLRSLEYFPENCLHINTERKNISGYICEYSLTKKYGFVVPFIKLYECFLFYIDDVLFNAKQDHKVFVNEMVLFDLSFHKNKYFVAKNIRSCKSNDIYVGLNGFHPNWSYSHLPMNKSGISSQYKLCENVCYHGLIEFAVNSVPIKGNERIFFEKYNLSMSFERSELQSTDIQNIRRCTKVEFYVGNDLKIKHITGPRQKLLTYFNGQRGQFYRWRNINCNQKLECFRPTNVENCNSMDFNIRGFITFVNVEKHCGIIEVIEYHACYQAIYFEFHDVIVGEKIDIEDVIKISTIVQFDVECNESFMYFMKNENDVDPKFHLENKAIQIKSLNCDRYLTNNPPMFDMLRHCHLAYNKREVK